MDALVFFRVTLLFIVFSVTLALNMDDNVIARLGFEANFLTVLLIAITCTAFAAGRHALIITATVLLCLNANMPMDFTLNLGFDRDFYAGMMGAVLLQPVVGWAMQ